MLFIHLHQLRFHSHHGVYQEEQLLGGAFEVDVSVGFHPPVLPVTTLSQTLDYTRLYQLVKARMAIATPLLETIATELAAQISAAYPAVEKINIHIRKLYPPVNNFEGSVGVSFEWNK